jgi:hypothetical protein
MSTDSLKVLWQPGTDTLLGICHCGAEHLAGDPIEIWSWLHAHPAGHGPAQRPGPPARTPGPPARTPSNTNRGAVPRYFLDISGERCKSRTQHDSRHPTGVPETGARK